MASSEIILGALPYGADIVVGEELEVGTFTIGGTTYTRYVKVLNIDSFEAPPSGSVKSMSVLHNISNVVGWLTVKGIIYPPNGNSGVPIPYMNPYSFADTITNQNTGIYASDTAVTLFYRTTEWSTNNWKALIILEYYK